MNKTIVYFLFITLSVISVESGSQDLWKGFEHLFSPPNNYVVYQTISDINIDGKPNERSWEKADWSAYFQDIEGDKKPRPLYKTRFKMLWDSLNLYILAELEEPHIWAYYNIHDQVVFHENDFEVFIDPNRDTHEYFEFELNAQNTLFDLFLPKPYRNGGPAIIEWNAKDFKSAVHVEGTLNNPLDRDKKWTLEMAIPFEVFKREKQFSIPKNGDRWKVNFSRVQWQTEVIEGKYQKKRDSKTNKALSENNWTWSVQGVINMHFPERWGIALFSTNPVNEKRIVFKETEEEKLAKYLWLIYYKQQHYKRKNGMFSPSLNELEIPSNIKLQKDKYLFLALKADKKTFSASLKTNDIVLSINQEGLFENKKN